MRTVARGGHWDLSVATSPERGEVWLKRVVPQETAPPPEQVLAAANAIKGIDHPNIARVLEVARHGAGVFVALDMSPTAVTLTDVLSAGRPVPLEVAAQLVADAAAAVQAASDVSGGVHGALHPASLVVDQRGVVSVIMDGVAGPLPYRSPEHLQRQPVDARSDIYSLGVLLYQLTTGRNPFGAANEAGALLTAEVERPSRQTAGYPEALERAVLTALTRDVWVRYQRAADFERDLRAFVIAAGAQDTVATGIARLAGASGLSPPVAAAAPPKPSAAATSGPAPRYADQQRVQLEMVKGRSNEKFYGPQGGSKFVTRVVIGAVLAIGFGAIIFTMMRDNSPIKQAERMKEKVREMQDNGARVERDKLLESRRAIEEAREADAETTDDEDSAEEEGGEAEIVIPKRKRSERIFKKVPRGAKKAGQGDQTTGTLTLTANLRGARVFANGKLVGRTPLKGVVMYSGEYDFEVRAGPSTWSRKGTVAADALLELSAKLDAARVFFQGFTGGECTIDGKPVSVSGRQPVFVGLGAHKIRCVDSVSNVTVDESFESRAGGVHRFMPKGP